MMKLNLTNKFKIKFNKIINLGDMQWILIDKQIFLKES